MIVNSTISLPGDKSISHRSIMLASIASGVSSITNLNDGEDFCLTYGDGLANVDIAKLLAFHKSHGKLATMTSVRPVSRFGVLDLAEDSSVKSFEEKPQSEGWINAGYFIFEPQVFDYLETNSILEREPLTKLAREGQLMAFKHEGFFQPMDTLREMMMLNEMWDSNKAPWKVWK